MAGSHSVARANSSYWSEATRPLSNLIFVVPMLLCYEAAMFWLGPQALRNGADVWLRSLLDHLGFGQYFLLPILTCGILLAWHHLQRQSWQFSWTVCYGMLAESVVFALLLLVLAQAQGHLFAAMPVSLALRRGPAAIAELIGFFGAGIYEELLFRLMLLPVLAALLRVGGLAPRTRWTVAVVISSVAFAAAHYEWQIDVAGLHLVIGGEPFDWFSFAFRCAAGAFFSLLFLFRGFGIAAGSHALYDILVILL